MQINLRDVFARLGPNYPPGQPLVAIAIYIIAFLIIITLFLQKKSSLFITILIAITVMAALIDKIDAWRSWGGEFFAYFVRIAMFVCPLVVAGMTRSPKSRGPAILAGVIGMVYLFARWFFEQKPS